MTPEKPEGCTEHLWSQQHGEQAVFQSILAVNPAGPIPTFFGTMLMVCEEPTWRTKFPKMLKTLRAASWGQLGIQEGIKSTQSTVFYRVFCLDSMKSY